MTLRILAALFLCASLHADGPPIKDGHIEGKKIVLKMSPRQVESAGRVGFLELELDQVAKIKKTQKGKFPRLIYVITDPYNDCTCGLGVYGLWTTGNDFEIPSYRFEGASDVVYWGFGDEEEPTVLRGLEDIKKIQDPRQLHIDSNGEVFQLGERANNFKQALQVIKAQGLAKEEERYIGVSTPPLRNLETIKKTYLNIKNFFEGSGYRVFAYFEEEYLKFPEKGLAGLPVLRAELGGGEGKPGKAGSAWKLAASSTGAWKEAVYAPGNMTDDSRQSAWVEGVPGAGIGESITISGLKPFRLGGFEIENGFGKSEKTFRENGRVKDFLLKKNGKSFYLLRLLDRDEPQHIRLGNMSLAQGDKIELVIQDVYGGVKYQDTAITELRPIFVP